MRDHRRRVQIRLISIRVHADELAKLVRMGKTKFYGELATRHAATYNIRCIVAHQTDGSGTGDLPGEFKRANPRIPWKAIERLRHEFVADIVQGKRLVPDPYRPGHRYPQLLRRPVPGTLWRWASVMIPRIARLLEHPREPQRWYNESHGSQGIEEIMEPHQWRIKSWMHKYHIKRLRVFGSVARGEADGRSDVDLIVDLDRRYRWYPYRIAHELRDIVGRRVSIDCEEDLYWATKDRVLSEAVVFA